MQALESPACQWALQTQQLSCDTGTSVVTSSLVHLIQMTSIAAFNGVSGQALLPTDLLTASVVRPAGVVPVGHELREGHCSEIWSILHSTLKLFRISHLEHADRRQCEISCLLIIVLRL